MLSGLGRLEGWSRGLYRLGRWGDCGNRFKVLIVRRPSVLSENLHG